ncbi:MAG TPA: DnaB-like helicase C-terminal domain-containing protein [Planctomycetaceae bacterium]|nr:DnaB-like helicase C-terminal domain-containing protein [Planctomycetaceae bacterium]
MLAPIAYNLEPETPVVPPPAPDPAESEQAVERLLSENGEIALKLASFAAVQDPQTCQLVSNLNASLHALRMRWRSADRRDSVEARLFYPPRYSPSAVMAFEFRLIMTCVLARAMPQALAALAPKQIGELIQELDTSKRWDPSVLAAVLGDFLPPAMIQDSRPRIRASAYRTAGVPDFAYVDDVHDFLERLEQARVQGDMQTQFLTGIEPLDARLNGLGALTVIGGAPRVGKTDLAIQMGLNMLRQDPDSGVIVHESDMPKDEIFLRMLSNMSRLTEAEVRRGGTGAQQHGLQAAKHELHQFTHRIEVCHHEAGAVASESTLASRKEAFVHAGGLKRVLVIVDYFQKVAFECTSNDSLVVDRERLEHLLGALGQRGAVPSSLLLISEVRKTDGERDLALEDLAGSARLGYAANNVILLQPQATSATETHSATITANVVKARHGHHGKLSLHFDYPHHAFSAINVANSASAPTVRGTRSREPRQLSPIV